MITFNLIIMNILQKNSEYPMSITEIKLLYQHMLEIGLQADKTFGIKKYDIPPIINLFGLWRILMHWIEQMRELYSIM